MGDHINGPALLAAKVPVEVVPADHRVVWIGVVAIAIAGAAAAAAAAAAALVAQVLTRLIWLGTNVSFHGRFSAGRGATPLGNHLGLWVLIVPVIGGSIVGLMARYGSKAIRGHGIPQAMEQVLLNESRIPARTTFLKPLISAVTGGLGRRPA